MGRRNQKQELKRRRGHVRFLKREADRIQSARGTARARAKVPPKVEDVAPRSVVSGEAIASVGDFSARAAIFRGDYQGGEQ